MATPPTVCTSTPVLTAASIDTKSVFEIPVRVYYEDTDAGGIVYYANYLKFFERARTEQLRALGIEQRRLREERGIVFVVRSVEIEYLRSAVLDDALHVSVAASAWRRSALRFHQQLRRAGERLAVAEVSVVCMDARRARPCAIPADINTALTNCPDGRYAARC